jgi:hypothetical protein
MQPAARRRPFGQRILNHISWYDMVNIKKSNIKVASSVALSLWNMQQINTNLNKF